MCNIRYLLQTRRRRRRSKSTNERKAQQARWEITVFAYQLVSMDECPKNKQKKTKKVAVGTPRTYVHFHSGESIVSTPQEGPSWRDDERCSDHKKHRLHCHHHPRRSRSISNVKRPLVCAARPLPTHYGSDQHFCPWSLKR